MKPVKQFRKYTTAAFEKNQSRPVTPSSWNSGDWVRHAPTKTWFEAFESVDIDGSLMLVGFGFYNENVIAPLTECTHAFDPALDASLQNSHHLCKPTS